ncbi:uncharacterized protein LOC134198609 [Corticium candelabrum]|uniref:uncharacterized protein LOC134198609 n=1 Tax=Corticium candelabrum TaxID=121492 RepID=UPI002E275AF0|nr:uncharacterized protein LOC134198609 [Corticium candelabrum]
MTSFLAHFLKCVLPNIISVVSAFVAFVCIAAILLGGAYDDAKKEWERETKEKQIPACGSRDKCATDTQENDLKYAADDSEGNGYDELNFGDADGVLPDDVGDLYLAGEALDPGSIEVVEEDFTEWDIRKSVELMDDALAESDRELMKFLDEQQQRKSLIQQTKDLEQKIADMKKEHEDKVKLIKKKRQQLNDLMKQQQQQQPKKKPKRKPGARLSGVPRG